MRLIPLTARMAGIEPRSPRWITSEMLTGQASVLIWGNDRPAVNRAAWELASRLSPEYQWVQVGEPDEQLDPEDPVALGLVPRAHLYRTVPPERMAHDRAAANLAMWAVVRADDPNAAQHPLIDFLRLPGVAQELLGSSARWGDRAVCVIANADRITQYYPDEAEDTRARLGVWRREQVSVIATFPGVERGSRFEYDYAFELRLGPNRDRRRATMICEKDRDRAPNRIGVSVPAFDATQM